MSTFIASKKILTMNFDGNYPEGSNVYSKLSENIPTPMGRKANSNHAGHLFPNLYSSCVCSQMARKSYSSILGGAIVQIHNRHCTK